MREMTASDKGGKWSDEDSSTAGLCTAMGHEPVSVAALTRAVAYKLDAMGITDKIIRGFYLRASIFDEAEKNMF